MSKLYFTAAEVAEMMGVSKGQAYKVIQKLNAELEKRGYLIAAGKVTKKYFLERYYGGAEIENSEVM